MIPLLLIRLGTSTDVGKAVTDDAPVSAATVAD